MSETRYVQRPAVIKESYGGIKAIGINDEMLTRREIEFVGQVDAESINSLISQVLYLNYENNEAEITIYINSNGGEVNSGLALYDIMQAIKCPIRTICVGMAASMGALLFTAGDTREILPHSKVMIHDPLVSGGGYSGSALQIKENSDRLMKTREDLAGILAKHTNKTIEEIYEKTKKDCYFSAEEAVEFGLADRIITTL